MTEDGVRKAVRTYKSNTHDERFVHIRDIEDDKFQAVTVFARNESENGDEGARWYCTFAVCWKKDQFSKEIGRDSARRKYFLDPLKRAYIGPAFSFEIVRALATEQVERINH